MWQLKITPIYYVTILQFRSPAWCDWILCSQHHKAKIMLASLNSLLETLGKNLLSSSFKLLAEFNSSQL